MKKQESFTAFALVLNFLSRMFLHPPEETLIQSLLEEELLSHWPLPFSPVTRKGLKILNDFIRSWTPGKREAVKNDYTRLFIGLEKTAAPPYASVYLSREHIIFDISTLEIRDFYRRYGLKSRLLHKEPDDHIGLELSFLGHLCQKASSADDSSRFESIITDSHRFLDGHLKKWLPDFCSLVKKHSNTEFYPGAAYLTEGTIATLNEYMDFLS